MNSAEPFAIHTSDRNTFRRCRRQWDLGARNRQNLIPAGSEAAPLWFGSGMHFAMEDYHGYRRFARPHDALRAYADATAGDHRPGEWRELLDLGAALLDYYTGSWLPRRDVFTTVLKDGVPQVEVPFEIPLAADTVYRGTFDRIVADEYGRLFVMDYKFISRIDTAKLDYDPQITAYCWAASQFYGRDFDGVVYMQFKKAVPEAIPILKNGGLSQNKSLATTYSHYHAALQAQFGEIPPSYADFLGYLMQQESADHGDLLIRRDVVYRNAYQVAAEGQKILAEAYEMTDPMLSLYPNPTRDCSWCSFASVCLAMDDGSDWEAMLAAGFECRQEWHDWRGRIVYPDREVAA